MMRMPKSLDTMSTREARALFLEAQGLAAPTDRPGGPAAVLREVHRLGFVQLDSINVVERAHHHILYTRLHRYAPGSLAMLQRRGDLFEHWTHDASFIPSAWFPHWRHRFAKFEWNAWLRSRIGPNPRTTLDGVLERIRRQGALRARDFEQNGARAGTWWDWRPAKAALEYWWRRGELAIPRRERFEKVYDLTERVLPGVHALPTPGAEDHLEWACRGALERLGVGTVKEIASFWMLHTATEVKEWCAAGVARGEVVPVRIEGNEGGAGRGVSYAFADWRARAAAAGSPPTAVRVLSPFDPVVRDRARALRLFNFDYRFEAFVPAPKRVYGYYVLPIMQGDRLIGRLDPKVDRASGTLHIRGVWWEPGVRSTRALRGALEECLEGYAAFNGAARVEMPTGNGSRRV